MKYLLTAMLLALPAAAETFTYWIEPCSKPAAECEASDVQLAEWAMQDWGRASRGALEFVPSPLSKARIRLYWAEAGTQGLYGEARAIEVQGKSGAEVYIRPNLHALGHKVEGVGSKDRLFRHAIVYLTCLHETGHALGMEHTRAFTDIMYSFEYGGNILEYFGRYRRRLHSRDDIRTLSGVSTDDQRRLLTIYTQAKSSGPAPAVSADSSAPKQAR